MGCKFYDADDVLEQREQRTIKDFFAESEDTFRAAETRTLAYLAELEGAVIATGGGAVKRAENMELMKRKGVVVFLDRKTEQILGNIEGDARPLLAADKQRIFKLYEERIELYRQYADKIITNTGDFGRTLAALESYAKQISE